jgi:hypothetical protein
MNEGTLCKPCKHLSSLMCTQCAEERIAKLEAEVAKAKLELQQEAEADIQTMETIKNIEADNSHLRDCLKRYGRHELSCARKGFSDERCTCGLAAELEGR